MPKYDYVLAPFSRSRPDYEKWAQVNWQELVSRMPDKSFAIFGNPKYDDINFIQAPNAVAEFGRPFTEVSNILLNSKGAITIISGISHLAYALNVKNYLLGGQNEIWGINPESVRFKFSSKTDETTVSEVQEKLNA